MMKSAKKGYILTPREATTVRLFASGEEFKQIAGRLGISITTVSHRLQSARAKVGAKNNTEMVYILAKEGSI